MAETPYKAEIVLDSGEDLDDDKKQELLRDVAKEAGVSNEVEFGNPVKRQSVDPVLATSLGMLFVNSVSTLILLLEHLDEDDSHETGIIQTGDGRTIGVVDADADFVENHGGTVIGEVEGDVVVVDDAESMELTIALNKKAAEDDDVGAEENG